MSQPQRPLPVTILSWYMIVSGLYTLVYFGLNYQVFNQPLMRKMMEDNPLPIEVQIGQVFAGGLIFVVSGFAILKGFSWGRKLCIVWLELGIVLTLFSSSMSALIIPSVIFLLVAAYILYRPEAKAYFASTSVDSQSEEGADSEAGL